MHFSTSQYYIFKGYISDFITNENLNDFAHPTEKRHFVLGRFIREDEGDVMVFEHGNIPHKLYKSVTRINKSLYDNTKLVKSWSPNPSN